MNLRKIIYATDFSPSSEPALKVATSLARDSKAKLLIVHVEEVPVTTGTGEYLYDIPLRNTQALEEQLSKIVPNDSAVVYEHRLLTGHPADEIVRLLNEESADMIVIGTHGRRGLTRLLMGSIAEAVMRSAPCPVLTVRQSVKAT
jgi:nucleotide-binding universal stress UspA family protein